jgi:cellulose synthase/poly-beta-1,6-N-acetylglucosamine synthase-like glycosyltransferase
MFLLLFWISAGLIVYTYVLFPTLIFLRGLAWPRPIKNHELDLIPSVSVIISAYNEERSIGDKLKNLLSLDYPKDRLEVVIASDGSTDRTNTIIQAYVEQGVKFLALPRQGKAAALNAAVAASTGEILVFSDANSIYKSDAISALVKPFADATVGGVAGDQRYLKKDKGSNAGAGERMYWNFDRLMKKFESRAGNTISATGAIYAIRRSLFQAVEEGVTDDFFTSTGVIAQGHRLVFAPEAVAYEPVADSSDREFGRKVRVITRGLKAALIARGQLLNPFRYGFYAIQLFSHKVMRRLIVYPLLTLLLVSPFLWKTNLFYQLATMGQLLLYGLALTGFLLEGTRAKGLKFFTIPFYFCLVNAAALVASINVLRGRQIKRWEPQRGAEGRQV